MQVFFITFRLENTYEVFYLLQFSTSINVYQDIGVSINLMFCSSICATKISMSQHWTSLAFRLVSLLLHCRYFLRKKRSFSCFFFTFSFFSFTDFKILRAVKSVENAIDFLWRNCSDKMVNFMQFLV